MGEDGSNIANFVNAFWIRVRKKYGIFANANPKRVRKKYGIFCERESKTRSQKIWYLLFKMAQDGSTVAQDGPKMVQDGPARLAKVLAEVAEFFKKH